MKTRNSDALDSFTIYCHNHPHERFWQALRNWSRFAFILGAQTRDGGTVDTFNYEGLDACRNATDAQPQVERESVSKESLPTAREWRCVWGVDCCTVGFTEARCDEFIRRNPEMKPRKQQSIDGGKTWVDAETGA